jgi:hypothetical protein
MLVGALLALGITAPVAHAQEAVGDGAKTIPVGVKIAGVFFSDSTGRVWAMDTNHNGKVVEQFPAYDQNLTVPLINNSIGLTLGSADSSAVIDTHRMRLGMLVFKPFPGSGNAGGVDTTTIWRIAYQVRTHVNGGTDSSSYAAIYNYGNVPQMSATGAVAADSSVAGQIQDGVPITAQTATPSANTTWSGEYTLLIEAKRFAHGSAIAINGHTYYYPNAMAISLSSLFGREVYSAFTSLRVRVMTCQKGTGAEATAQLGMTVTLLGTPL